ncbi:corrinoid ABC transporter substrate-binding protein [Roseimaritima multifibrata]|uniref:Corrinoid ABC transporter substrate-binding protein n=1 Tax=Roseimaritima multifibrata TaxID=1930274 RepID=A0A517MIQ0_9BACT|nr:cobalamin-binding protein [Roseimaritima multifibrata]QDS94763.1 corrinoid ABC transporter substrate-binding protein [Roseimaritima multifibrata]
MRIVSLLPSATEMVCALGLRQSLVGVTHECDFPADVRKLPAVTRSLLPADASSSEIDTLVREQVQTSNALYSLDTETIQDVQPDLIITQALCDVCAVAESEVNAAIRTLPKPPQVLNLEPRNLADVLDCLRVIGIATGTELQANRVLSQLENRIAAVVQRSEKIQHKPRTMVLEWIDPPFSAGHWNPELVELAGGVEVVGVAGQRSVTVEWKKVVEADPEVLVIACCGFDIERSKEDLPILQRSAGWQNLRCVKDQRVHIVDGSSYFNRPGPRLVDSLEILASLIHPDPTGSSKP